MRRVANVRDSQARYEQVHQEELDTDFDVVKVEVSVWVAQSEKLLLVCLEEDFD